MSTTVSRQTYGKNYPNRSSDTFFWQITKIKSIITLTTFLYEFKITIH